MPILVHQGEPSFFTPNEYARLQRLQSKIKATREFSWSKKKVPLVLKQYAEDLPPAPRCDS